MTRLLVLLVIGCDAYTLRAPMPTTVPLRHHSPHLSSVPKPDVETAWLKDKAVAAPCLLALATAMPAEATDSMSSASVLLAAGGAANSIPSAFAAYGHYLALILATGALVTERMTIKPAMSKAEEERMSIADITYGGAGLLLVVTGYLRVTQYGKGWEFYSHEPIFWLKMVLLAVMGAASFFPTTKIIQRSIAMRGANPPAPMSEKLADRMTTLINAQLLAIATIPLTAALMSRGVGYADWFPWQAGAALVALSLGGLGFKYVKEALDWQE